MRALSTAVLLALGYVNAFADIAFDDTTVLPSLEEYKFRDWMREYSKNYHSKEEYKFRYSVFKNNMRLIEKTNEKHTSYRQGLNKWSDMTDEDFEIPDIDVS